MSETRDQNLSVEHGFREVEKPRSVQAALHINIVILNGNFIADNTFCVMLIKYILGNIIRFLTNTFSREPCLMFSQQVISEKTVSSRWVSAYLIIRSCKLTTPCWSMHALRSVIYWCDINVIPPLLYYVSV